MQSREQSRVGAVLVDLQIKKREKMCTQGNNIMHLLNPMMNKGVCTVQSRAELVRC